MLKFRISGGGVWVSCQALSGLNHEVTGGMKVDCLVYFLSSLAPLCALYYFKIRYGLHLWQMSATLQRGCIYESGVIAKYTPIRRVQARIHSTDTIWGARHGSFAATAGKPLGFDWTNRHFFLSAYHWSWERFC